MIETHPLKPFLPENAQLLMLGSFPPPKNRWKMDFYYPNYQNDMWRMLGFIFFNDKEHFLNLSQKNFKQTEIENFLQDKGIAIFDTAYRIERLQNNASDKFLQVVEATHIEHLLEQIPLCHSIVTTGDKATDTLVSQLPQGTAKPKIGDIQHNPHCYSANRDLYLYRMPSTSRAYPLALEKKADMYRPLFQKLNML